MDYRLLKEIIAHIEAFEKENPSQKVEDFVVWLNTQLFSAEKKDVHAAHDELLIAFKLMHLNKDLKKRMKHILSASRLASIDEYSFLLHLDYQDSFRKMELVELHNLEAPTGIEIIKRLLKNQFLVEFPDPDDKRAKRIRITEAGLEELRELSPQVNAVFADFTAPLSLQERVHLSGMLDKLA